MTFSWTLYIRTLKLFIPRVRVRTSFSTRRIAVSRAAIPRPNKSILLSRSLRFSTRLSYMVTRSVTQCEWSLSLFKISRTSILYLASGSTVSVSICMSTLCASSNSWVTKISPTAAILKGASSEYRTFRAVSLVGPVICSGSSILPSKSRRGRPWSLRVVPPFLLFVISRPNHLDIWKNPPLYLFLTKSCLPNTLEKKIFNWNYSSNIYNFVNNDQNYCERSILIIVSKFPREDIAKMWRFYFLWITSPDLFINLWFDFNISNSSQIASNLAFIVASSKSKVFKTFHSNLCRCFSSLSTSPRQLLAALTVIVTSCSTSLNLSPYATNLHKIICWYCAINFTSQARRFHASSRPWFWTGHENANKIRRRRTVVQRAKKPLKFALASKFE